MKTATLFVFFISTGLSAAVIWFSEQFDDENWEDRWIYTQETEYKGKPFGRFQLSSGRVSADPDDKGLRTMSDNSFYAISTKIQRFSNRNTTFVIQFTMKHETKNRSSDEKTCAAVLLKLLPSTFNPKRFNGDTRHLIRYGPDLCTTNGRVRADLWYKGKIYEHKGQEWGRKPNDPYVYPPYLEVPQDGNTHLFTFAIFPNNTYEKRIDGEVQEFGTLAGAWELLPQQYFELEEERPADWDEREFIVDPNDTKPADWDAQEYIPDPYASKPEDWDDVTDGPWEHPIILNPKYKGEWSPTRFIRNPNYKGAWKPRTVENPDYVYDPDMYLFKDIAYVGLEMWQEHSGTLIDNILLTDDLEGALKNGTEWQKKFFELEERTYNHECDMRQKILMEEVKKREKEIKEFKKRMKKTEL